MGILISASSQTSLQVELNGLGKPANEYYNFRATIYEGATFRGNISWTSSSTGNLTRNTFYNLTPGTYYTIHGYVTSLAGGTEYYWGQVSGYTDSPPVVNPPTSPSWIDATASTNLSRVSVSWGSVSNVTGYVVRLYYSSGTLYTSTSTTSTSYTFSSLPEYTSFYAYVHSYNDGGSSSGITSYTVQTPDLTAPTINLSLDGDGRVNASWSASDSGSGLRSTNTYYVEISNANGTTYGNGRYTTNTYETFTADGQGLSLENNATYYVRVTATDNSGNSRAVSSSVVYKSSRPIDWEWTYPKVQGSNINLSANEWNAFCTRINQFRVYKGYSNYPFTTVQSGNTAFASQLNEAIDAMDNFASVPSLRSSGQDATATFFNLLRDYLNAVV